MNPMIIHKSRLGPRPGSGLGPARARVRPGPRPPLGPGLARAQARLRPGPGAGPGPAQARAQLRPGPGSGPAWARPGHRSGPAASTESGTTAARSVSKIGYRNVSGEIPISHLVSKSPKRVQKPAKSAEIRPPPTPHSYQHMLGSMSVGPPKHPPGRNRKGPDRGRNRKRHDRKGRNRAP